MAALYLFTLLSCLLFVGYGVLIAWYLRAWKAMPVFSGAPARQHPPGLSAGPSPTHHHSSSTPPLSPSTRISVIVPARNEEPFIGACLAALAGQTYPADRFEVIVVDDHSTDRTAAIVQEFAAAALSAPLVTAVPVHIKCIRLAEQPDPGTRNAHKKWAIETGIKAASGDLIVATDADCRAHSDWLSTIAAFYEATGAKFIAAPVRIAGGSSSFLAVFQTLDFITLQGITAAAVYKRFHSMCNGANLAYEKKAFYEADGFKGIDAIPSGDDMLLMHKIYRLYPQQVFFLKHRHAIVTTSPETRWKGFLNQRIRWASKADRYDDKRIFWVLLLVYSVNFLFAALLVAAFWNSWWLWLLLLLLTVKTVVEYPFVRSVAAFFEQQRLMVYFAALQPFHIVYTIVVGWLGKFGSYHWKDRKISK